MKLTAEKKSIFQVCYLSGVFVLLLISIVFCFLGLFDVIDLEENPYFSIDAGITGIFWIEYLVRFARAEHTGEYLKETFLELLSILPFSPEFAVLHAIRLLRFFRLVKIFPSLPLKFTKRMHRARIFCKEFFNSKGLAYVLMAGTLILATTVFALDRSLSLPYFQALKMTAVSCFSLTTAPRQAQISVGIFLAVLCMILVWTPIAIYFFSKRFRKLKRAVGKMMSGQSSATPIQTP